MSDDMNVTLEQIVELYAKGTITVANDGRISFRLQKRRKTMNPRLIDVCEGSPRKTKPGKAQTIHQFKIVQFLKANFDMETIGYEFADYNTVEMWDNVGGVAIITTDTDDTDYVEVEDGIFFCEI